MAPGPHTERELPIGLTVEAPPAGMPRTTPRWVEAERDYRTPVPVERARLLRAAYQAATSDAEQRLLLAELMAHYRRWCLGQGLDDPFAPDA